MFEPLWSFSLDDEGRPNRCALSNYVMQQQSGQANKLFCTDARQNLLPLSSASHLPMNDRWQVISVNHHGVQPLADNMGEGTTVE